MKALLVKTLAVAMVTIAMTTGAFADWAPEKPIDLLIGYQAGGGADTLARTIAKKVESDTGWQIVSSNKTGGGGAVLANTILHAAPDGYTFGMIVTGAISATKRLRPDTPFDVESFDYLGTAAKVQYGIVAPKDAPFNDIASMAAYAKKKGSLTIGSMGPELNILADYMSKSLGIDLKVVPAKGGAGVRTLVLAGQVDLGFSGGYHPNDVAAGQMKLIATMNSERLASSPNTPTLAEQGVDTTMDLYFQFIAPKGIPEDAKAALAKAISEAVASSEVKDLVENKLQMQVIDLGPEGTLEATDKARDRTVRVLEKLNSK